MLRSLSLLVGKTRAMIKYVITKQYLDHTFDIPDIANSLDRASEFIEEDLIIYLERLKQIDNGNADKLEPAELEFPTIYNILRYDADGDCSVWCNKIDFREFK